MIKPLKNSTTFIFNQAPISQLFPPFNLLTRSYICYCFFFLMASNFIFLGKIPFSLQNGYSSNLYIHNHHKPKLSSFSPIMSRMTPRGPPLRAFKFLAVPGDNFIAALRSGAGNQRRKHTVLLDTFHGIAHRIIVQNLEGMVLEWKQLSNRNLPHLLALFFLPGFFGGKNIIVAAQTGVYAAFRHRPAPPRIIKE